MMKLKIGDIFTIPISDELTGFGQIVNIPNKNNFVIVVFEKVYSGKAWPGLNEIIDDKILLLGYTMDAKLYHKHWVIIGNYSSNLSKPRLPYYKLGTPPDCKLVDFRGNFLRRIPRNVFDRLDYQTVYAPVEYELALKAYHKLVEWEDDFNELLYERTLKGIEIVDRELGK